MKEQEAFKLNLTDVKPSEIFGSSRPTSLGDQALRKRMSQWISQGNGIVYFDMEASRAENTQ